MFPVFLAFLFCESASSGRRACESLTLHCDCVAERASPIESTRERKEKEAPQWDAISLASDSSHPFTHRRKENHHAGHHLHVRSGVLHFVSAHSHVQISHRGLVSRICPKRLGHSNARSVFSDDGSAGKMTQLMRIFWGLYVGIFWLPWIMWSLVGSIILTLILFIAAFGAAVYVFHIKTNPQAGTLPRLDGKTVLLTGGNRGVGLGTAKGLSSVVSKFSLVSFLVKKCTLVTEPTFTLPVERLIRERKPSWPSRKLFQAPR